MKGALIYKILNSLDNKVFDYIDFTNAFLKAGYGASSGKIKHEYSKLQNKRIDLELNVQKVNNFKKAETYKVFSIQKEFSVRN